MDIENSAFDCLAHSDVRVCYVASLYLDIDLRTRLGMCMIVDGLREGKK